MAEDTKPSAMQRFLRGPLIWIAIAVAIIALGSSLIGVQGVRDISTQQGLSLLASKDVEAAKIVDGEQRVELTLTDAAAKRDGMAKQVRFYYVEPRGEEVLAAITAAEPKNGFADEVPQPNFFSQILLMILPIAIIIGFFWFFMMSGRGGDNRIMQFGKARAKGINKETPKVTFADVAGIDEALDELREIKEFLAEPAKFQAVGARIPKGVLLYGPPGTGKTLIARAVAGEAGVPFFSISGSDFVEMFVGVGASRVRDLFDQAKQNAPAIIFVDEIDAVGRHRGAGMGGGHDEREQTLNQLLVEMDGFDATTNVIMIAATNRPDILDPALLRPGRFDRQVAVDAPDLNGRKRILEIHARNKPLAEGVDLEVVARRTPGFSGADLANVLNEAALLTARANGTVIDDRALDEAIDRVIAGPQRRTRVMKDQEKLVTAYHEGGHAVVAAALNHTDPVTKVTILPRGRALGYTMVLPTEDKYSVSRNELLDQLAYALGGRVAEELVFHDPTTGAGSDIDKATATARKMVTEYGMTSSVGMVKLSSGSGEVFLGRDLGQGRSYSEHTAEVVDNEVRALIENAHNEAWQVLRTNRAVLDRLAEALLEHETLDQAQLAEIFKGIKKLPKRKQWLSSPDRPVSNKPPVKVPAKASPDAAAAEQHASAEKATQQAAAAQPDAVSEPPAKPARKQAAPKTAPKTEVVPEADASQSGTAAPKRSRSPRSKPDAE